MTATGAAIECHASTLPEGTVLRAADFKHLGRAATIRRELAAMARQEGLIRVARGWYVALLDGRFGRRGPAAELVAESWSKIHGQAWVVHPAASANRLQLSTQVPVRLVYLTDGRGSTLMLGKLPIEFKHTDAPSLMLGMTYVGELVRALEYLGPERATVVLPRRVAIMTEEDRRSLVGARDHMEPWLAQMVSQACGLA